VNSTTVGRLGRAVVLELTEEARQSGDYARGRQDEGGDGEEEHGEEDEEGGLSEARGGIGRRGWRSHGDWSVGQSCLEYVTKAQPDTKCYIYPSN